MARREFPGGFELLCAARLLIPVGATTPMACRLPTRLREKQRPGSGDWQRLHHARPVGQGQGPGVASRLGESTAERGGRCQDLSSVSRPPVFRQVRQARSYLYLPLWDGVPQFARRVGHEGRRSRRASAPLAAGTNGVSARSGNPSSATCSSSITAADSRHCGIGGRPSAPSPRLVWSLTFWQHKGLAVCGRRTGDASQSDFYMFLDHTPSGLGGSMACGIVLSIHSRWSWMVIRPCGRYRLELYSSDGAMSSWCVFLAAAVMDCWPAGHPAPARPHHHPVPCWTQVGQCLPSLQTTFVHGCEEPDNPMWFFEFCWFALFTGVAIPASIRLGAGPSPITEAP